MAWFLWNLDITFRGHHGRPANQDEAEEIQEGNQTVVELWVKWMRHG
jgi:hypothetical protein